MLWRIKFKYIRWQVGLILVVNDCGKHQVFTLRTINTETIKKYFHMISVRKGAMHRVYIILVIVIKHWSIWHFATSFFIEQLTLWLHIEWNFQLNPMTISLSYGKSWRFVLILTVSKEQGDGGTKLCFCPHCFWQKFKKSWNVNMEAGNCSLNQEV